MFAIPNESATFGPIIGPCRLQIVNATEMECVTIIFVLQKEPTHFKIQSNMKFMRELLNI